MIRDVRKFVVFRWRLLECPKRIPVNLSRLWRDRYGYVPPYQNGAVAGWHFLLGDGYRGVIITRPDRLQVPDPIRAQALTLIGSKHKVDHVRIVSRSEAPDLRSPDRLPTRNDLQAVEEWPPEESVDEPLVAEYASSTGMFVPRGFDPWGTAGTLTEAATFATAEEAERELALQLPAPVVSLRYLAAARAEADQREAAILDEC